MCSAQNAWSEMPAAYRVACERGQNRSATRNRAADAGPVSLPFDMRTEAMTRTLHDRMEATLRDLRTGAPR